MNRDLTMHVEQYPPTKEELMDYLRKLPIDITEIDVQQFRRRSNFD